MTRSILTALLASSFLVACTAPSEDLTLVDDPTGRAIFDAFEGGQLAVPTQMDWSIPQMVRGADITITVQGGPDTAPVLLAATTNVNGSVACPAQIAPECMDIAGPFIILGTTRSDAAGTAVFNLRVPPSLAPSQVRLQAVSLSGGVVYATPGATRDVLDAVTEDCNDGVDNDADGLFDCTDDDCFNSAICGLTPAPERGGAACTDGIDNDGNGFTDCADFSCQFDSSVDLICGVSENTNAECTDGDDNDGNGFSDCAEWGCTHERNPAVTVCLDVENIEGACADGADNNGNGLVDCADPECAGTQACGGAGALEGSDAECSDGLDNDGDLDTDCADSDCANAAPCVVAPEDTDAACTDSFDNDGDGDIDCFDADCAAVPACALPTELDLMVNEFLADPDADMLIGDANCDGVRDSGDDEFVELVNYGVDVIDLTGVTISDGVSVRHEFAAGEMLMPGDVYVVFGGGTPTFDGTSNNPSPWCGTWGADVQVALASSGSLGLNNGGDTILIAVNGSTYLEEVYGGEAGDNQSVSRLTDGDVGSAFDQHTLIPNNIGNQSPGWRVDGTAF